MRGPDTSLPLNNIGLASQEIRLAPEPGWHLRGINLSTTGAGTTWKKAPCPWTLLTLDPALRKWTLGRRGRRLLLLPVVVPQATCERFSLDASDAAYDARERALGHWVIIVKRSKVVPKVPK